MKVIASAILAVLTLLVFSALQLVNVRAVKASGEAAAVFRSTGGLWWFEQNGWPNEDDVSLDVALRVHGLFPLSVYELCNYYNDGMVTKDIILTLIEDAGDFDYATFFIFANGVNCTFYDVIYYVVGGIYGYPVYYIPVTHYQFYDTYDAPIRDFEIGEITRRQYEGSTIHFVFLWTCVQANEIGSYHYSYWIYYPYYFYQGSGAAGMPFAWTFRSYTQMSSDGYASPDSGSYCFIGFEGFGIPLSEDIPGSGGQNYGDFVKQFYYYALREGCSINQALDAASANILGEGKTFQNTELYTGYSRYLPGLGWWTGRMRVYGNGNNTLPH